MLTVEKYPSKRCNSRPSKKQQQTKNKNRSMSSQEWILMLIGRKWWYFRSRE